MSNDEYQNRDFWDQPISNQKIEYLSLQEIMDRYQLSTDEYRRILDLISIKSRRKGITCNPYTVVINYIQSKYNNEQI